MLQKILKNSINSFCTVNQKGYNLYMWSSSDLIPKPIKVTDPSGKE